MNTTSLRLLTFLFSLVFAGSCLAQNETRAEEEARLDEARRVKVEEAIRARQEEAAKIEANPELYANPEEKKLVEVEPNNILPADLANVSALIPYRIRRSKTGLDVGISYSMFDPINYESDYASASVISFEDLYGSPSVPLIELYMNYKRNMDIGSIGLVGSAGYYKNEVKEKTFGTDITLSLQILKLGGKFILDSLGYEPKIVPYVEGGAYTVLFKEENGANSFNGNTEVALYYSAGLMAQLNWIDQAASVEAYSESGIENTFLFAEVRQYMASSNERDPDFSTDPTIGVGMSLEF